MMCIDVLWEIWQYCDQSTQICLGMTYKALYARYHKKTHELSMAPRFGDSGLTQYIWIMQFVYRDVRVIVSFVKLSRKQTILTQAEGKTWIVAPTCSLHVFAQRGAWSIEYTRYDYSTRYVVRKHGKQVAVISQPLGREQALQTTAKRHDLKFFRRIYNMATRPIYANLALKYGWCIRIQWCVDMLCGTQLSGDYRIVDRNGYPHYI